MKKITDISAQKNNPLRCNIFLDGSFYCGLELETVMRHRLKAGMEIEEERLDEIQFDSERVKATDRALSFISRSKKTKKQIREYLFSKGYTLKTVEAVIEKLENYSYIDDEDYAAEYVKSLSQKKGKRLLAMELKLRGVSEKDMSEALENIGDETESATAIARKYLKNKPKDRQNIQKCYKYLLSKGFDYDTAKTAVEKIEDEDPAF